MPETIEKIIQSELEQYALPFQRLIEVVKAVQKVNDKSKQLESLRQYPCDESDNPALHKYIQTLIKKLEAPGSTLDPSEELAKGTKAFSNKAIKGDIELIIEALKAPAEDLIGELKEIDRIKQIEAIKLHLSKEFDPLVRQILEDIISTCEADGSELEPITELTSHTEKNRVTLFEHLSRRIERLGQEPKNIQAQPESEFVDVELIIYKWFCQWRQDPENATPTFEFFYTKNIGAALDIKQWQALQVSRGLIFESAEYHEARTGGNNDVFTNRLDIGGIVRKDAFLLLFAMEYSKYSCNRITRSYNPEVVFNIESYEKANLRFADLISDTEEKIAEIGDPVTKVISDANKPREQDNLERKSVFRMDIPEGARMGGNLLGAIGAVGTGAKLETGSRSIADLRGAGKKEVTFTARIILQAETLEQNMITCLNHLAQNLLDLSKKNKATTAILADFSEFILSHPDNFIALSERFAAALKFTDYDLYHIAEHSYEILPTRQYNSKASGKKEKDTDLLLESRKQYAASLKLFFAIFFENYHDFFSIDGESGPAKARISKLMINSRELHVGRIKEQCSIPDQKQKQLSWEPLLDIFILTLQEEHSGNKPREPYPLPCQTTDKMRGVAFQEPRFVPNLTNLTPWLKEEGAPKLLLDLLKVITSNNLMNISKDNLFIYNYPTELDDSSDIEENDLNEISPSQCRELAEFMVRRNLLEIRGVTNSENASSNSQQTGREQITGRRHMIEGEEKQPLLVIKIKEACDKLKDGIKARILAYQQALEEQAEHRSITGLSMFDTDPMQKEIFAGLEKELNGQTPFSYQIDQAGESKDQEEDSHGERLVSILRLKNDFQRSKDALDKKEANIVTLKARLQEITAQNLCQIIKEKCNTDDGYSNVLEAFTSKMTLFLLDLEILEETFQSRLQQFATIANKLSKLENEQFIKARQDLFASLLPIDSELADIVQPLMLGIKASDLNQEAARENEELKLKVQRLEEESRQRMLEIEAQKQASNNKAQSVSEENTQWLELLKIFKAQGSDFDKWKALLSEAQEQGASPEELRRLLTTGRQDRGAPQAEVYGSALATEQKVLSSDQKASPKTPIAAARLNSSSSVKKTPITSPIASIPQSPAVTEACQSSVRTPLLNKALADNARIVSQVKALLSSAKKSVPEEQHNQKHGEDDEPTIFSVASYKMNAKASPIAQRNNQGSNYSVANDLDRSTQRRRVAPQSIKPLNLLQRLDTESRYYQSSTSNSSPHIDAVMESEKNKLRKFYAKIIFFSDENRLSLNGAIFEELSRTMLRPDRTLKSNLIRDHFSYDDKQILKDIIQKNADCPTGVLTLTQENNFLQAIIKELLDDKDNCLEFINSGNTALSRSTSSGRL